VPLLLFAPAKLPLLAALCRWSFYCLHLGMQRPVGPDLLLLLLLLLLLQRRQSAFQPAQDCPEGCCYCHHMLRCLLPPSAPQRHCLCAALQGCRLRQALLQQQKMNPRILQADGGALACHTEPQGCCCCCCCCRRVVLYPRLALQEE
jgi:hypothetical protein